LNLKTFTAPSMAAALLAVRQQFGADAVILHTRTYKRGGIFGIGAKEVVEVTAGHGKHVGQKRRAMQRSQQTAKAKPSTRPATKRLSEPLYSLGAIGAKSRPQRPPASEPAEQLMAGDLIRQTYQAARAEFERAQSQQAAAAAPVAVAPMPRVDTSQLDAELGAVKRMVAKMMRQQRTRSRSARDMPEALFNEYLALLQQDVSEELAEEIVQQVRGGLSSDAQADAEQTHRAIREHVASLMQTDSAGFALRPTSDGRPRTIALIGPTGVGKTTTIAKLAATFKLKQRKRVALVTLDTYRIAAVDQLRTYANIIGVPLHVVGSPTEIRDVMHRCSDVDVVLIDTAGRSQRDGQRLEQLDAFLKAAQPHETHLVLPATAAAGVLFEAIEKFSALHADHLIFTKLDEAVSFGILLNIARRVHKTVSFVTTGQEVPNQIEAGESKQLAALVLGDATLHDAQTQKGKG